MPKNMRIVLDSNEFIFDFLKTKKGKYSFNQFL
jgi:hypothetical protein